MRINTKDCQYNVKTKTLTVSSELVSGEEIDVVSQYTGRIITFVVDQETMIANEHFDGEEIHYKPKKAGLSVKLVVCNYF